MSNQSQNISHGSEEDHYNRKMINMLEDVWGEGFLSPGGPQEVKNIIGSLSLQGKKVLDIGCGSGGVDIELVKTHHALHVTGIDVEAEVLIRARELIEKYKLQNAISLLKVKPGAFPLADAEFDVVFSKDSIIHIQDKHALMNEVYRVLKPGGCFLASDWLMSTFQVSVAMKDYIAAEGLGFQMACPQTYNDAMLQAGFCDISIVSRNQWYRVQARSELELLMGQTGNTAAEKYGRAFIDLQIDNWQRMLSVLDSGELCPSHLHALKPLHA